MFSAVTKLRREDCVRLEVHNERGVKKMENLQVFIVENQRLENTDEQSGTEIYEILFRVHSKF